MQACRARLQGAQHDAVAGNDDAAQKLAVHVNRLDRHGRAHHDHDQRAVFAARQHAVPCAYHRDPAVGTQTGGVVVTVGQPSL